MMLAGEKKCMPITSSGRPVTAAISFTSSADVFVASTAPGFTIRSRLAKISFFRSMFSNTASITRSQSASASRSVTPLSRPMHWSTCSIVIRPRLAVRS